jgi:hypothetical protein
MTGRSGAAVLVKRLFCSFLALVAGSFLGFNVLGLCDFLHLIVIRHRYHEPLPTVTLAVTGYVETFLFMTVIAIVGWIPAAPVLIMKPAAALFQNTSKLLAAVYGGVAGFLTMGAFLGALSLRGSLGAEGPFQYIYFAGFVGLAAGMVYRSLLLRFTPPAAAGFPPSAAPAASPVPHS